MGCRSGAGFLVLMGIAACGPEQPGRSAWVFSDELDVDGSRMNLLAFFRLLDRPDPDFAIVTP